MAQTLNTWGCVFADEALLQGLLAQRLFSTTFLEGVNCFSVCERKRVKDLPERSHDRKIQHLTQNKDPWNITVFAPFTINFALMLTKVNFSLRLFLKSLLQRVTSLTTF